MCLPSGFILICFQLHCDAPSGGSQRHLFAARPPKASAVCYVHPSGRLPRHQQTWLESQGRFLSLFPNLCNENKTKRVGSLQRGKLRVLANGKHPETVPTVTLTRKMVKAQPSWGLRVAAPTLASLSTRWGCSRLFCCIRIGILGIAACREPGSRGRIESAGLPGQDMM